MLNTLKAKLALNLLKVSVKGMVWSVRLRTGKKFVVRVHDKGDGMVAAQAHSDGSVDVYLYDAIMTQKKMYPEINLGEFMDVLLSHEFGHIDTPNMADAAEQTHILATKADACTDVEQWKSYFNKVMHNAVYLEKMAKLNGKKYTKSNMYDLFNDRNIEYYEKYYKAIYQREIKRFYPTTTSEVK